MEPEENKITLAQAIKENLVPKYNRKRNKDIDKLLVAIGKNLPDTQIVNQLKKVSGLDLIADNVETIEEEAIDPNKEYTVFEAVETKVNQVKRLKQAYDTTNSPFNVIFYGFKFIGEEYKNEWIEIINDVFNTSYQPATIEEEGE